MLHYTIKYFVGVIELIVTTDSPDKGTDGTLPDQFLMTANLDGDPKAQLDMLETIQPNRPKMVMQYSSGGSDFWASEHYSKDLQVYTENFEEILKYPSSVNIYMFVGGTNYGFLNGALNLNYDDENTGKIFLINLELCSLLQGYTHFHKGWSHSTTISLARDFRSSKHFRIQICSCTRSKSYGSITSLISPTHINLRTHGILNNSFPQMSLSSLCFPNFVLSLT